MLTIHPATVENIAQVKPKASPKRFAAIAAQVNTGNAFLLTWKDQPMALAGLAPSVMIEMIEVWTAFSPEMRGSKEAGPFVRAMVRQFNAIDFPDLAVIIYSNHRPGERMASLMGFKPGPGKPARGPHFWFKPCDGHPENSDL